MTQGVGRYRQQVGVDLVLREGVASFLRLRLLAHRRPGVGVHDGRSLDDGPRVGVEDEPATGGRRDRRRPLDEALDRAVARRMRDPDLHAQRRAHEGQRVVDVVAVPDERQRQPAQVAEPLVEREQVGQHLARVLADREPVDDRDGRLRRELDDHLVRPRPGHDPVDEALEVVGDVVHALPAAEHDALGQVDRVAAELGHARLERHARAQARPLEQHREGAPLERRVGVAPLPRELVLELGRAREQHADLVGGQIRRRDEVPPLEARARHRPSVRSGRAVAGGAARALGRQAAAG